MPKQTPKNKVKQNGSNFESFYFIFISLKSTKFTFSKASFKTHTSIGDAQYPTQTADGKPVLAAT